MPAYGPGAIINQGGRPTYGSAVANLLDAIQGRQNQQATLDDQKRQQAQAAREARIKGVMEDLSRVPASKVQEYIAQLPPDVQEDVRNHGRGLIKLPMTADEYQDQLRIRDFTELGKLDPTDPRVKASTEARTYAYLTKRDLPPEQWQATMTGNLQGTPGLTEANRIANKQQVTADEAADNALAGRKFNEIEKPLSVATIGKTRAETGKLGAETATERMRPGLIGAQTAEAREKARGEQSQNDQFAQLSSGVTTAGGTAAGQPPPLVKMIIDRDYDPRLMVRWKPEVQQQILGLVRQYDPQFSMQDYSTQVQTKKDFTSGNASRNVRSLNTAVHHLESLKSAGDGLGNRQLPAWNTVANWTEKQKGDARVTRFDNAANAVAGEMASLFKNNSGTDPEIAKWRSNISSSMSPEQLDASIREMVGLMAGRLSALHDQYRAGTGLTKDITILSDQSRKVLSKMGFNPDQMEQTSTTPPSKGGDGDVIRDPSEILRRLKGGK